MTDRLDHRFKIGVIVPSTNTSCRPERDALRVPGVTDHVARMFIHDDSTEEKSCWEGPDSRGRILASVRSIGDDPVSPFFTDSGYDVVEIVGLGRTGPAKIAHVSEAQLCAAVREVDGPDVQAIVQVGTNVAMARVATSAEEWLDKPVISNNVALYWPALRHGGVHDVVRGFGSLPAHHLALPGQANGASVTNPYLSDSTRGSTGQ